MHSSKFKEIEKRLQYTGEKKCAWCTLLITLFINFHVFAEIGCKTGTFARNARVIYSPVTFSPHTSTRFYIEYKFSVRSRN